MIVIHFTKTKIILILLQKSGFLKKTICSKRDSLHQNILIFQTLQNHFLKKNYKLLKKIINFNTIKPNIINLNNF